MRLPVICIAGATGAGKTALAIELARHLDGEIINADSRQVYADLPIVTAQPTVEERACAPHHLYGFLPCSQKISAGQWLEMAASTCGAIAAAGKIPILTGGTGFYFEALLHGLAPMPAIPAEIGEEIASRLLREGVESLYRELALTDPEYASKIHPHDRQRIARALEVHAASGKTFSWWHAKGRLEPFAAGPLFVVGCSLAWLEPRLAIRIEKMLRNGATEEAAKAWRKYGETGRPAFNGIGVRELLAHLAGKTDLPSCRKAWLAATRAYAKRQLTWFRGRREAVWIDAADPAKALGDVMAILRRDHM